MDTTTFAKKLEGKKGLYRLNLSVLEEREFYLESVGGEEHLKKYPMLYDAFLRSVQGSEKNTDETAQETVEVHFSTYDIMTVDANGNAACDEERMYLIANISGSFLDKRSSVTEGSEPAGFQVFVNGKIYDPDSSRAAFMEIHESYSQVNQINRQFQSESVFQKKELWDRKLCMQFTVSVYEGEDLLATRVYTNNKTLGGPTNMPIEEIVLEAPISVHTETNEIRILYARTAANLEKPDYTYGSNNPDNNGGIIWTIVPIKGSVKLKSVLSGEDYYSFLNLTKPVEGEKWARSTLAYDGKDWKIFRNDLRDQELYDLMIEKTNFTVTTGDNKVETLHFDLFNPTYAEGNDKHYDWRHDIDKAATDNRERICYLEGCFSYDIGKKNKDGKVLPPGGISYQIEIRSVNPADLPKNRQYYTYAIGSQVIYIPPIHLWWGCYAKDTRIRMADGSKKRADEVRIGDQVIGASGRVLTVDNVYKGMESALIQIDMVDGERIQVSKGHPMLRSEGKGQWAEKLCIGDELMLSDNRTGKIAKIETVKYEELVYNFSFAEEPEGCYLVANDFIAGDFLVQNKLSAEKRELTEEERRLAEELQTLAESLKH